MWYSIESRENKGPHRKETQNGFAKDSATRMSVEAECEPSRGLEDGGSGTHNLRDTWKDTVGPAEWPEQRIHAKLAMRAQPDLKPGERMEEENGARGVSPSDRQVSLEAPKRWHLLLHGGKAAEPVEGCQAPL